MVANFTRELNNVTGHMIGQKVGEFCANIRTELRFN